MDVDSLMKAVSGSRLARKAKVMKFKLDGACDNCGKYGKGSQGTHLSSLDSNSEMDCVAQGVQ